MIFFINYPRWKKRTRLNNADVTLIVSTGYIATPWKAITCRGPYEIRRGPFEVYDFIHSLFGLPRFWHSNINGQVDQVFCSRMLEKPSIRKTEYSKNRVFAKPSIRETEYSRNPVFAKPSIRKTGPVSKHVRVGFFLILYYL